MPEINIIFFKSLVPSHIRRLATGRVTSVRSYYTPKDGEKPKSAAENIRRGNAAMSHVLATKSDFSHAMYRSGLGWVDFKWGNEGSIPSNSGKRKGAFGISHILEARNRKDGLNRQQSRIVAMMLVETIARGTVVSRNKYEATIKILVNHKTYEVALVKQGGESWVVTGWVKD